MLQKQSMLEHKQSQIVDNNSENAGGSNSFPIISRATLYKFVKFIIGSTLIFGSGLAILFLYKNRLRFSKSGKR